VVGDDLVVFANDVDATMLLDFELINGQLSRPSGPSLSSLMKDMCT